MSYFAFISGFYSLLISAGVLTQSYNGPWGSTGGSEAVDSKDEGLEGYDVIISVELIRVPLPLRDNRVSVAHSAHLKIQLTIDCRSLAL